MAKRSISINKLCCISYALLIIITFTYGRAMTVIYGGIEILIACICYTSFFKSNDNKDRYYKNICIYLIITAFFGGLLHSNMHSPLLLCTSLIMPIYISTLDIHIGYAQKEFMYATIVATVLYLLFSRYTSMRVYNSNTMGFVIFMGVSYGFVWAQCSMHKTIPVVAVIYGLTIAAYSGSRNVAVVGVLCLVMVLIPKRFIMNRTVYAIICILALLYTIFAADVIDFIFSRPKLGELIVEFTSRYSNKAWEMSARADYLRYVKSFIAQKSLLEQMFGTGILEIHGHNMFYQCVLEFGYIGTILIYILFLHVFRVSYRLIKLNDEIALGCAIALIGNILLQGADVYLLGSETYAIIPQLLIGIILYRDRMSRMIPVSRKQ